MVEGTVRLLSVGQGEFTLDRFPRLARQTLRAWDAADEYVLQHLAELDLGGGSVLVVNDGFGALTVALAGALAGAGKSSAQWIVQMQSDSWLAHTGARANLEANGIDGEGVSLLDSLQQPAPFDVLLFKVPRSLALLEDQLHRLRPHLTADTVIVGAGMVKQIHTSTLDLCERLIGPTRTSLARRKARLIHGTLDTALDVPANSYPTRYCLDGTKLELSNHAALFSRQQLDVGTRFLLEHLPRSPQARCIVDLGCGNGVLGIVAGRHHREAALVFTDESAMAIASTRENVAAAFGDERDITFHWADGCGGVEADSVDLILCNPPFHQQQAMGDAASWRMFQQARKALQPGGSLWVVGNRHLGYHTKLRRLFGNGEIIASNPKFVILKATKRDRI